MNLAGMLADLFAEKTCVVGMGNTLRRDDAVGAVIAEQIARKRIRGIVALNVEDVIENHVFTIAAGDAKRVLIVDAVKTGAAPGTVVFGPLAEFKEAAGGCSHKASLSLAGAILAAHGKEVHVLGIEAADTGFGCGMSEAVARSARAVCDIIRSAAVAVREIAC
jgi:hydrogenase maturation protease